MASPLNSVPPPLTMVPALAASHSPSPGWSISLGRLSLCNFHATKTDTSNSWFTITMSTGGLAVVASKTPFRFRGLTGLGTAAFLLALVSLVLNSVCIATRFLRFPHTFRASLLHPSEGLFVSASLLSIGTTITGAQAYGAPLWAGHAWFADAMLVCFWTYCAATLTGTVFLHILM